MKKTIRLPQQQRFSMYGNGGEGVQDLRRLIDTDRWECPPGATGCLSASVSDVKMLANSAEVSHRKTVAPKTLADKQPVAPGEKARKRASTDGRGRTNNQDIIALRQTRRKRRA